MHLSGVARLALEEGRGHRGVLLLAELVGRLAHPDPIRQDYPFTMVKSPYDHTIIY